MSDDEEEDKFVAAMRLGATDKWCLVRSYSELANAPPEGIRAVTSMEELKVVLGHENKTAHPLLTRLRMHPYSNYIEVLEHPELDTDHKKINMAELALLVKHQGPIQLSDYIFRNNVETEIRKGFKGKLTFYVLDGLTLSYNPQKARANIKRRESFKRRAPVYMSTVQNVAIAFQRHCCGHIAVDYPTAGSRLNAVCELMRVVTSFSVMFGNTAHRSVKEFQDLCREYKAKKEATKKYYKLSAGDCVSSWKEQMDDFLTWLDEESSRRRFPKPINKFEPRCTPVSFKRKRRKKGTNNAIRGTATDRTTNGPEGSPPGLDQVPGQDCRPGHDSPGTDLGVEQTQSPGPSGQVGDPACPAGGELQL